MKNLNGDCTRYPHTFKVVWWVTCTGSICPWHWNRFGTYSLIIWISSCVTFLLPFSCFVYTIGWVNPQRHPCKYQAIQVHSLMVWCSDLPISAHIMAYQCDLFSMLSPSPSSLPPNCLWFIWFALSSFSPFHEHPLSLMPSPPNTWCICPVSLILICYSQGLAHYPSFFLNSTMAI